AEEVREVSIRDHERADRRRRRDSGGPRLLRHERDLAEEIASTESADPLAVLRHVGAAVEDDDELAPALAFPPEGLALRHVDLVRDRRDLVQPTLGELAEERNVPDQVDLRVLGEPHGATLTAFRGLG